MSELREIPEKVLKENDYRNMFQGCVELTVCPSFGKEKQQVKEIELNKVEVVPVKAKKFDDFDWDDNMKEAYK